MIANIKIREAYLEYKPPVQLYQTIELLLRHVPDQHLKGLKEIILSDSENLRRSIRGKITRDKQRFRAADCNGLYYPNGPIILVIDQIFSPIPEVMLLIPMVKAFFIGEVLYHEIGHHIHAMGTPGYRTNKEAVADEWSDKLMSAFVRKRYWYVCWLLLPISIFRKQKKAVALTKD